MKVWVHGSVTKMAYHYFHVFTGTPDKAGYVEIEKSLIEFGSHGDKQNFQKPGEKIFIGAQAVSEGRYDLHDKVITFIIKGIFEEDFVLDDKIFKVIK